MAGPTTPKYRATWRGLWRANLRQIQAAINRANGLNIKAGSSRSAAYIPTGAPFVPVVNFPDVFSNMEAWIETQLNATSVVPPG
jgi:hypothetical protein